MEWEASQSQRLDPVTNHPSVHSRCTVILASPLPTETDAVVIGAGPIGLFQAFQLGLQGICCHVIDALPHAGGQCVELYGDKPIYDIPGIAQCSGRELADLLLKQLAPMQPHWHWNAQVAAVVAQPDGRFLLETSQGAHLLARTVFIAAGVGAFLPRTLQVEGAERFVGTQLHYQYLPQDIATEGRHVVVHGGGEAAVTQAIALAEAGANAPARVTLLHRRDAFQAPPAISDTLRALRYAQRIHVVIGQITGLEVRDNQPVALQLVDNDGAVQRLPMDLLIAVLGLSPRMGPIASWGLAMERKQLVVDTQAFCTSVPGIYAVGDINTYPGKRKLILCGFHEATLAAFAAAEALAGGKVGLQYTTTSALLHQRLGVAHASSTDEQLANRPAH